MLKSSIEKYFGIDKNYCLKFDRAFLALYKLFCLIKKKHNKKKVLFTSNTCPTPIYAAIYANLEPVFVDINKNDFLMDEEKTIEEINKGELASVVYIYTYGHVPSSIERIKNECLQNKIVLIEDVAQALGSRINGKLSGLFGHYSIFSFGYSKHVDAGAGGLLFINSDILDVKKAKGIEPRANEMIDDFSLNKYKKDFYNRRYKALFSNDFRIFSDMWRKYKKLFFDTKEPNWKLINESLNDFFERNKVSIRNSKAMYYHNHLKRLSEKIGENEDNKILYAPQVRKEYSIYRYSFLTRSLEESIALSDFLRKNDINCSNLYLPISRFFCENGFDKAVDLSKRVINFWVDDSTSFEVIKKTVKLVYNYYGINTNIIK